jgi:acyl-CoA thioesterase-1
MSEDREVILAFGDSLTAGHGVMASESYPAQLQKKLDERGFKYRVVNQGISGDTTTGGLSRIDAALAAKPKIVILELGANDGLRGLPVQETKRNLEEMIVKFQAIGSHVVLAGMTLPLNYGPDYIRNFENLFVDLARQYHTELIPFFLQGVAARADLNLDDGIHPTGRGYTIIAQTVFKAIEPLL